MSQVEFYSHVDDQDADGKKTMEQHLREVMEHGGRSVSQLPHGLSRNEGFRTLVKLSCLCHDFGKFTTYFQKYLLEDKKQGSKHHHGFISALFTAFQVNNASLHISPQVDIYLPLISYICVLHHHGNLENLDTDIIRKDRLIPPEFIQLESKHRTGLKNAEAQIADMQKHQELIEGIYRSVFPDCNLRMDSFAALWIDFLRELDKTRHEFENKAEEEIKRRVYIYLLVLYSILIDADKKSAGDVDVPFQRKYLSPFLVDEYRKSSPDIDSLSKEGINGIRNEIYYKVVSSIDNVDLDTHIMTLTSPTGTGKTLSALSAALKLRARIEQEKGFAPRIIYSLPFTSIIDQNSGRIEDVLSLLKDYQDSKHQYLLKHHYLSNVKFKGEGREREPDNAILLIESWESEIVVTTFVQILQTIIGFRNRSLKKYHKIAGSIMILDEVQNIPVEYWLLVSNSLKLLCETLGCYVILLTATKPLLFNEDECLELVQGNLEYFSHFHRTRLNTNMEGISLDDMARELADLYDESKSFLIVANTIKSSLYLYEKIAELIDSSVPLYYLSSNIIPRFRRQRINEISKALKCGKNPLVVSTQVVEAGVDLDFDRVIRDLGPIDSVVQVAGRCNRAGNSPRADVYVYNIMDDQGKSLSKYVYGPVSTDAARSALASDVYEEEMYHTLVNEFFKSVKEKKSLQKSRDIWDATANLCFHTDQGCSVSDFSLIESLPDMVDVFVQVDECAVSLWKDYHETVLHEKDMRKKQLKFLCIKADFHSHIISVPGKLAQELIPIARNFYLLPHEGLEKYYDHTKGFKRIPEETTWIL